MTKSQREAALDELAALAQDMGLYESQNDLVYRLRKRAEIRRQIPSRKSVQEGAPDRIADLLEEAADALAQPEQEPVAWLSECTNDDNEFLGYTSWTGDVGEGCFPVYKEARGWVELTEYEFEEILAKYNEALPMVVCRAIEAKLKEKNT
jgi:hypothetical protein